MNTIVPTTELEAVNAILYSIGESPIASFAEGFVDSDLARDLLNRISKAEQIKGFEFNTLHDYTIQPDGNGHINLPQNTLKIVYEGERRYLQLGSKLWDNVDHTDVFTKEVCLTLIIGRDFDLLPESLRIYCYMAAARKFQSQMAADSTLYRISSEDVRDAKAGWMNYISETEHLNVVNQSPTVYNISKGRFR